MIDINTYRLRIGVCSGNNLTKLKRQSCNADNSRNDLKTGSIFDVIYYNECAFHSMKRFSLYMLYLYFITLISSCCLINLTSLNLKPHTIIKMEYSNVNNLYHSIAITSVKCFLVPLLLHILKRYIHIMNSCPKN